MKTKKNKTSDGSSAVNDAAARDAADACLAPVILLRVDLWVVVLTDQAAVHDRKPISGHQANAADSAREAVDVVGVLARPHHHLRGRDRLTTRRAGAR